MMPVHNAIDSARFGIAIARVNLDVPSAVLSALAWYCRSNDDGTAWLYL